MLDTGIARIRNRTLAALDRLGLAWTLTLTVVCIDLTWLLLDGWSVPWRNVAATSLAVCAFYIPLAIPRYRNDPRIRTTVLGVALLIAFQAVGATLSYLVVSTNAPLVDASLAAWDRALGFDWLACLAWIENHPSARAILRCAYYSGLWQLVAVVLYLGFSARSARLREFMRLFALATLLTIVISGLLPAAGAWKHYAVGASFDLASTSHFELLRSGRMHDIPLGAMQGLISLPSLHSAMAVLLVYAMRGTFVYPLFAVLNAAMLASTPIEGGHYFVDVLAGVALALGFIALDRLGDRQASKILRDARPRGAVAGMEAMQR